MKRTQRPTPTSASAAADWPNWPTRGMCAVIFIATLLAYLPALGGGFIWDDMPGHVTRPELQSLGGLGRIWFGLREGATQQYYPVLHTAFWLEHRLWGDSLAGYHLLNIALHSAAALLLVAILRRLAIPGAGLGGFRFSLHPGRVEAGAGITAQKKTLS